MGAECTQSLDGTPAYGGIQVLGELSHFEDQIIQQEKSESRF